MKRHSGEHLPCIAQTKKSGTSSDIWERPDDIQTIEFVTDQKESYNGQEAISPLIVSSLKNPLIASTNHTAEYPQGFPSERMDYSDSTLVPRIQVRYTYVGIFAKFKKPQNTPWPYKVFDPN